MIRKVSTRLKGLLPLNEKRKVHTSTLKTPIAQILPSYLTDTNLHSRHYCEERTQRLFEIRMKFRFTGHFGESWKRSTSVMTYATKRVKMRVQVLTKSVT
jgi:hypothetical protein